MNEPEQKSVERFVADAGFLFSNLLPRSTGIAGAVVWLSAGEFAEPDPQLGPRLLVVLSDDLKAGWEDAVSVRLTDPSEVLGKLPTEVERQVVAFVDKNRRALLGHWSGELDSKETCDLLERV
jgi:hypothetical protein